MNETSFFRVLGKEVNASLNLWPELTFRIDSQIESFHFELSEEKVFFCWDDFANIKTYFIGRPIIGAKRDLDFPWLIRDFKVTKCADNFDHIKDWEKIFEQLRLKFPHKNRVLVVLNRLLRKHLELKIEVFFMD